MKRRNLIGRAFLLMVLLFLSMENMVLATNDEIDQLKPNEYKKNEIELNPRALQQENQSTENVPEEFQNLTFKQQRKKEEDEWQEYLFTEVGQKKSTLSSQVEELKLFSSPPSSISQTIDEPALQKNAQLKWVLIGLIGIAVILLFGLLLPRMIEASRKSMN
ncbi:type VII secretion protein EssA [Metabacillus iocasae]